MQSTLSLPLLPGPLWPWEVVPVQVPSMDQIEQVSSVWHKISSDSEVPVIMELWRMWSTLSLPLLPGLLWPRVIVPVRVPSMGQIELFNHLTVSKQMTDVKLNC